MSPQAPQSLCMNGQNKVKSNIRQPFFNKMARKSFFPDNSVYSVTELQTLFCLDRKKVFEHPAFIPGLTVLFATCIYRSMRNLLSAIILFVVSAGPAVSEGSNVEELKVKTSDVTEIREAILGQLEAFRQGDGQKAFSYASPTIRRTFKTPDNFIKMVRQSYAAVYHPQSFKFRPLQLIGGAIAQPLEVVGPSGAREIAFYFMEQQPDQSWRIAGCVMAQDQSENT